MRSQLKKMWSGVATLAVAASAATLLNAPAAYAAGVPDGPATVRSAGGAAALSSGNSGTTFTLRVPTGAACAGDSANSNPPYLVHTYMVPASVDPSTLTFDANGPTPQDVGAGFRQPLYDLGGSPVVNLFTAPASPAPGPGAIINIPDMNYGVFASGDIPAGEYNIGVACAQGAPSATQMKNFYNVKKTFTAGGGGPAAVNWVVGGKPNAPGLTSVTSGDGQLTANFTATTSDPPTTLFTATATPPAPGTAVTATSTTGSPIVVTGLTNGTTYSVTVKATNSAGDSAPSTAVSSTPSAAPTSVLIQRVTVTRPPGALVFTQICGKHNAMAGDAFSPAVTASDPATHAGPTTTDGGTTVDPNYPAQYPGPATPTYPTYCGVEMGAATLVRTGGKPFYAATGVLNQVTVVDTRESDAGWSVTGTMANLVGGASGTAAIAGNQLGWRPAPTATPPVDDGLGGTYTQVVTAENSDPGVTGLGTARALGTAVAGSGLGIAELDARLKLHIPITTPPGDYSGLLTLTLS